jgi:NADH-quinone oxidoreductase subunit J
MTEFFTPIHIIFYVFATLAIASGVAVITVRSPVRSVLSLVITFFSMAGIWMLLRAEFLSLILLLVYVGAVMTLFLFVVMMLNLDTEKNRSSTFVRYLPFGIILILLMTGLLIASVGPQYFGLAQMPIPPGEAENYSNVQQVGRLLFTQYSYPFEIAGVLLLVAIIAAITLAHRGPVKRKVQNVDEQIAVRPEDRVRLISMPSEPKPKSA